MIKKLIPVAVAALCICAVVLPKQTRGIGCCEGLPGQGVLVRHWAREPKS